MWSTPSHISSNRSAPVRRRSARRESGTLTITARIPTGYGQPTPPAVLVGHRLYPASPVALVGRLDIGGVGRGPRGWGATPAGVVADGPSENVVRRRGGAARARTRRPRAPCWGPACG